MVLEVQAALVVQAAHHSLYLADQEAPEGLVGQRWSRLLGPDGTKTGRYFSLDVFQRERTS